MQVTPGDHVILSYRHCGDCDQCRSAGLAARSVCIATLFAVNPVPARRRCGREAAPWSSDWAHPKWR
ncbi:hypothetical protein MLGJGCBP_02993 [Rhodococcus sp. T7]|nr:hypothetical protein MLGJGCBP_02993 [Rhodococcus sp. T7]